MRGRQLQAPLESASWTYSGRSVDTERQSSRRDDDAKDTATEQVLDESSVSLQDSVSPSGHSVSGKEEDALGSFQRGAPRLLVGER